MNYYIIRNSDDELFHHGINGQKWGIRRFQNPDGSLTPEGKERYGVSGERATGKQIRQYKKDLKTATKEYAKAVSKSDKFQKKIISNRASYDEKEAYKKLQQEFDKKANDIDIERNALIGEAKARKLLVDRSDKSLTSSDIGKAALIGALTVNVLGGALAGGATIAYKQIVHTPDYNLHATKTKYKVRRAD